MRLVYNDFTSSFLELLQRDKSVTVHQKNLHALAIEMFKVKNKLAPEIMNDVFEMKEEKPYNTRFNCDFKNRTVKTVKYGTESLSFLGPRIWNLIPPEIRNLTSLEQFKKGIKTWNTSKCPCRLCKKFVRNLGFLN